MAKITPELRYEILQLTGEGKNPREIAEILTKKYNVPISRIGVYKDIQKSKEKRKEIAREVAEKYVAESIPSDLEIMGNAILELNKMAYDTKLKTKERMFALKEVISATATRLKISGVGADDKEIKISIGSNFMNFEDEEEIDEMEVIEENNAIDMEKEVVE